MLARWLSVVIAALAMVATPPGRTHGCLITEPLLQEFQLDRRVYATMNLWATLLGAAFCVPGAGCFAPVQARIVLTCTLFSLAGVVVGMSRLQAGTSVAVPVDLAHAGFGTSACRWSV